MQEEWMTPQPPGTHLPCGAASMLHILHTPFRLWASKAGHDEGAAQSLEEFLTIFYLLENIEIKQMC